MRACISGVVGSFRSPEDFNESGADPGFEVGGGAETGFWGVSCSNVTELFGVWKDLTTPVTLEFLGHLNEVNKLIFMLVNRMLCQKQFWSDLKVATAPKRGFQEFLPRNMTNKEANDIVLHRWHMTLVLKITCGFIGQECSFLYKIRSKRWLQTMIIITQSPWGWVNKITELTEIILPSFFIIFNEEWGVVAQ